MKLKLIILIVLFSQVTFSQINEIDKVISGDFKAIKKNKIKQIFLKKNDTIVNRIKVIGEENELVTFSEKEAVKYVFNENGRPIKIKILNENYEIKYFNENLVKKITCFSKDLISTYYPNEDNFKSVTNELILDGKQHIKRFIFNKKDSLLSYLEIIKDDFSFKIYLNGIITRKRSSNNIWDENKMSFHFNEENTVQYDSLYFVNGNRVRFCKISLNNKDSIIITSDSIKTLVYNISEKNKDKLLEYERTERKEGSDTYIYNEVFYENEKPVKKIENTYKPYYSNLKDKVPYGIAIWEIKTTIIEENREQFEFTYPYKKDRFFKYRRGKLICEKCAKIIGDGPGIYVKEDLSPSFYDNYNICSPSIIITNREKDGLDRFTFIDKESKKYYDLDYYRLKFSDENKEIIASFTEPKKLRVPSISFSYLQSYIVPINYTIEILTEDNKKYNYKLNDFVFKVTPIVDIIAKNANAGNIDLNYYEFQIGFSPPIK